MAGSTSAVIKFLIPVASLALALAACTRMPESPEQVAAQVSVAKGLTPEVTGAEMAKRYGVYRFIDKEASVLCYDKTASGALSCVPLNATTIRR